MRSGRNLSILCILAAATITSASFGVRKTGWLDGVVQYRKDNFIKDVQRQLPAIEIHARIEKAPPGFEDSKNWDFESVIRLLGLLRQSRTGRVVHRALRRSMKAQPNRRIYMSFLDTYKYFPKIHQDNYYDDSDMESLELIFESTPNSQILDDSDVIIVSNPVEARLPSTKISVKMLRAILEERAFAARIMPPTTKARIDWKPMNKTKKPTTDGNKTEDGNSTSPVTDDTENPSVTDGDGSSGPTESTGASEASNASEASKTSDASKASDASDATVSDNAERRHIKKVTPVLRDSKPALRTRKPGLRNRKPVLQYSKPVQRNSKPVLHNNKPRLRNSKPGLRNSKLTLHNRKSALRNSKPVLHRRQ